MSNDLFPYLLNPNFQQHTHLIKIIKYKHPKTEGTIRKTPRLKNQGDNNLQSTSQDRFYEDTMKEGKHKGPIGNEKMHLLYHYIHRGKWPLKTDNISMIILHKWRYLPWEEIISLTLKGELPFFSNTNETWEKRFLYRKVLLLPTFILIQMNHLDEERKQEEEKNLSRKTSFSWLDLS